MLQKAFHVKSYDVYPNSTIKPSAIQHYMQQFAREDCDNMGCTYVNMRDVNMVFVLTKMGIKVEEPVFAYDELTVKTYNNRITGITFEREFEFFKNGKKVIHATTQWVIIKYDNRQIVRPRDFPFEIPSHNLDCGSIPLPRSIDINSAEFVGERVVRLSDLDENDHLNNCVYSDIFLDVVPYDRKTDYVKEVNMIFRQEARINETLSLSTAEKDGKTVISAFNKTENKPCFEAECVLGKITC
jgi:acyl-ACP thioesterase